MDTHLISGLADFLHQRGGVLRRSGRCGGCGLHGTGVFAQGAPFSGRGGAARSIILTVHKVFGRSFGGIGVFLPEVLPGKEDGAHRSNMRS